MHHAASLARLKQHGYTPDTILDIGAYHGKWAYMSKCIYPEANHFLFEAIDYPELESIKNALPNVITFQAILDKIEREVEWFEKQNTGDSMFREKTHHFINCEPVMKQTKTLASLIDIYLPTMEHVLIKIDCQGAEIPILQGAGEILKKTDFILLELPFFGQYNENVPNFLEHIRFMDELGFVPFDMVETHIACNFTIQVDIMFISKTHSFHTKIQQDLLV